MGPHSTDEQPRPLANDTKKIEDANTGSKDGLPSNLSGETSSKVETKTTTDDKEELSSSSGSGSEEKGGSRGGYSADCSASDQSSIENNGQKDATVALNRLDLNYEDTENSGESSHGQSYSSPSEQDCSEDDTVDANTNTIISKLFTLLTETKNEAGVTGTTVTAVTAGEAAAIASQNPSSPTLAAALPNPFITNEMDKSYYDLMNAPMFGSDQVLPQWNGVRISHPMDPRMDLATVGHVQAPVPAQALKAATALSAPTVNFPLAAANPILEAPTMEHYIELLSMVRPYFHDNNIPLLPQEHLQLQQSPVVGQEQSQPVVKGSQLSGSNAQPGTNSSEGFTSFFATTNSGTTTSDCSPPTSDADKMKPPPVLQQPRDMDVAIKTFETKAKYQHPRPHDTNEGGTSSSSSGGKRLRISKQNQQSVNINNDQTADPADGRLKDSLDASSSSFSSGQGAGVQASGHVAVPARVVTDTSSSNRTDSTASNLNTSGSGSAGNSNQGSSGSGNDNKGSSEELAKEDGSGNGTNDNDGSDATGAKHGGVAVPHRHTHASVVPKPISQASPANLAGVRETDDATREQKLICKKRKRIEMRREYEAQQEDFESLASGSSKDDVFLQPGKHVSMDQVLFFSRIPRIIIQANPPFLVVYANAAFTHLTGVHSHEVVGNRIESILSIPEPESPAASVDIPQDNDSVPPQSSEDLVAARAEQHTYEVGLERLVVACGFGRLHEVLVAAKSHQMVGRNVTIIKEAPSNVTVALPVGSSPGGGSNDVLLACDDTRASSSIPCRIAVAPVVSASTTRDTASVHRSNQGKEVTVHHRRHPHRQLVTHYVIQMLTNDGNSDNLDSLSSHSTSIEARLLGVTKAELEGQRLAAQGLNYESEMQVENEDGSTETKVPVAAIA